MAEEKNRISSSKREIYTKLLDIASKYTDISDTDYLRTGLFGYITESMASMMRDSTYHKDMIYRESNLNTAIIPETVYNWAKMFNIPVQSATPAYADIEIQLSRDYADSFIDGNMIQANSKEHLRYGDSVVGRKCLILDKKDQILAGDYYFALEHSIMLYTAQDTAGTVSYFAKYLTNDTFSSTNFQTLQSDYLTVRLTDEYIVIKARAYQYKFTKYTKQITTSTFMNKVQTYQFEDQFVAAKLYYSDSSGEKEIRLQYSNIDSGADIAYYNLIDKNSFELIFKSGDENFRPAANSNITLYILTTKGTQIPSYYSGDAIVVFGSNDLKSLPINIQFNPTDIIGGKDAPSINKIKQTIISELSTRKTITTKNDLNNYFNLLTTLIEDVNDGRVNFIKQRDDIIRRMYNAYLLIRDNTDERSSSVAASGYISSCVPTNTIKANIETVTRPGGEATSYAATDITGLYKLAYPCFSTTGSHNILTATTADADYYLCPFVIFVYDNPDNGLRKVQYIYNLVNQTTKLSYNNNVTGTNGAYYAVPISATLTRSFDMASIDAQMNAEDHYTLSLKFNTNFDAGEMTPILSNRGLTVSLGNSTISISSGDGNISFSSEQAEETGDASVFTTTMDITLPVNSSSEFNISDGYASSLLLTEAKNAIDSVCECSINGMFKVDNEDLGVNVRTEDKLTFYSILDTIMDSDIIENTGKQIIGLSDVPVVHSSFFHTGNAEVKNAGFIRQLFTYINILKENLGKLETSTFFNIKFYNTYGPSLRYDTVSTNVKLTLKIALYESFYNDPDSASLRKQIKSYIRRLVDQMNLSSSGIRVSSIISHLTSADTFGKYIDYIEFIELNGSDRQYVTALDVDNDIGVPPEWLNLDAECLANDPDDNGVLDSGIYFIKGSAK